MTYPTAEQVIPVPIPVRGIDTKDPLSKMDPYYTPFAINWEPEPQYLRIRNGWIIHATMTTKVANVLGMAAFGSTGLFVYSQKATEYNKIWDVTSAGVPSSPAWTGTDSTADEAYLLKFAGRSAFMVETDPDKCGAVYAGSWSAWGFTTGGSPLPARAGVSYKGRVYLFYGSYLYYSTLGAVTGACTAVDMSTLFSETGEICWAGVLTSPSNRSEELMLAFGNTAGEILVYAGDNPAATNWQQVGYFKIAAPLYYNSTLIFNNDIWIATKSGIISLRKLFEVGSTEGSSNPDAASVSQMINPLWRELTSIQTSFGTKCSMAYWPEQNKVYVLLQGYASSGVIYNSATMYVYNGYSGAWCQQMLFEGDSHATGVACLTYFNNGLYCLLQHSSAAWVMKMSTAFKDEETGSPGTYSGLWAELRSPFYDLGTENQRKRLVGWELQLKTDVPTLGLETVADFGRKDTEETLNTLTSGYQRVTFRAGIDGTYMQYKIGASTIVDTTSSTTGLELYSAAAIVK